jgi:hypothetical protein
MNFSRLSAAFRNGQEDRKFNFFFPLRTCFVHSVSGSETEKVANNSGSADISEFAAVMTEDLTE